MAFFYVLVFVGGDEKVGEWSWVVAYVCGVCVLKLKINDNVDDDFHFRQINQSVFL